MANDLVNYIEAIGRFLEPLKSRACWAEVSARQRIALEEKIMSTPMELSDVVKALEALKLVAFKEVDMDAVADAISRATQHVNKPMNRRRQTQDFTSVLPYYTDRHWREFNKDGNDLAEAMEAIVDMPIALGLTNPSESIAQRFAAIFFIVSEGVARARALNPQRALTVVKQFKRLVKSRANGHPMFYIETLPDSPMVYKDRFPEMYNAAFRSPRESLHPTSRS